MKYLFQHRYIRLAQVILLGSIILLGSCKKLIEIPPDSPGKVSTVRAYSDSLNVMAALAGIYATFSTGNFGTIITATTVVNAGLASDEMMPNPLYPELQEFYSNNILPASNAALELWSSAYKGIYQTNAFLEGVSSSTGISSSFKQQVTGEVLIARSLYYFHLVNQFGDVPVILNTDYNANAVAGKKPADSVYALIIRDLTSAMGMLSGNYPSTGRVRPNINTARAFLAKVYLYKGQWQQAADLCSQVIGTSIYSLAEPSTVFLSGSQEAIWQLPTLSTFSATSDAQKMVPYQNTVVPNYFFTSYQMNAFENNDLRKTAWTALNIVTDGSTTTEYYYPGKYKNTSNTQTPVEAYMLFRLGEQYLVRAEARAQLNLLNEARQDINKVRNRAGLGDTPASTKDEILAAIEKERMTELFAEGGNRWYDLKRTGRANAVLGVRKPGWTATDALFPIPASEIQSNVNLTQNPGYN